MEQVAELPNTAQYKMITGNNCWLIKMKSIGTLIQSFQRSCVDQQWIGINQREKERWEGKIASINKTHVNIFWAGNKRIMGSMRFSFLFLLPWWLVFFMHYLRNLAPIQRAKIYSHMFPCRTFVVLPLNSVCL